MVWDTPKNDLLSEFDWSVLGHDLVDGHGKIILPTRRIDVPIPFSADGIHTLAHRFAGLSEQLHQTARLATTAPELRSYLGDVIGQIKQADRFCKALRKEWEGKYQELQAASLESAGNVEQIRPIR